MSGSDERADWSALASHNERLVSALASHSERLVDAPAAGHGRSPRSPSLATAAALRLSRSSRIRHRYSASAAGTSSKG
jgi:hypothetical protein